ncbi:MAG TPA: hypothetical protein PLZ51_10440, partial [Aggregatilineales bacterium]|nr:hypothetical protein [Aggregatilineales bacterium]
KVAGANPWRALTLEWQTSSPPPAYNFVGDPIPFEDPYGYGTEASKAYLEAMAVRFGESYNPEKPKALPPSTTVTPTPEPSAGD